MWFRLAQGNRKRVRTLSRFLTQISLSEPSDLKKLYTDKLRECTDSRCPIAAKRIHNEISSLGLDKDYYIANLIILMYGRCGEVVNARSVFDSMPRRNRFSWTILIGAYAQNGHCMESLDIFRRMSSEGEKPSNVTYLMLLSVCADLGPVALSEGEAIDAELSAKGLHSDPAICNNLINMYGKCGSLGRARDVFDSYTTRDVIAWTSMIAAYAQLGQNEKGVELFWEMVSSGEQSPNNVTFIVVLGACSGLEEGRRVHGYILQQASPGRITRDVLLSTALVNMYGKSGCTDVAREIFDEILDKDVVAWNALIGAYAQAGQGSEALVLLREMDLEGVKVTGVTLMGVLDSCSSVSTEGLQQGKAIHRRIVQSGFELNTPLYNTVINMYGRCGSLADARDVFGYMGSRDSVSWAALIAAYAHHGHTNQAKLSFRNMELEGVEPSSVTFVSILSACSHAGMFTEFKSFFQGMKEHGIVPTREIYGCVIDLLGRLGMLGDVGDIRGNMPYEPGSLEWRIVLGACRTQLDMAKGSDAAEFASRLEPEHAAAYIMLSGLYETEPLTGFD